MRHWIVTMLAILLLLSACGTQEIEVPIETTNQGEKMMYGLVTKLEVRQEDKGYFSLILENRREEELTVNFKSGQTFEIIVRDESEEEVYRFSDGKMFTQAIVTEIIPPGSQIELKDEWDLMVNDEKIQPGVYSITGEFLIWTVDNHEVEEDDFRVSKEITIE